MLTLSADTLKCRNCGDYATVTRRSGHYCTGCLAKAVVIANARTKRNNYDPRFEGGPDSIFTQEVAISFPGPSGLRVGGTRKPRLTDGTHHPCLVTRADGTQYVMTGTRNVKRLRAQGIDAVDMSKRIDHKAIIANLAPVGDQNH